MEFSKSSYRKFNPGFPFCRRLTLVSLVELIHDSFEPPVDPEPLHLRYQCCTLKPKPGSSSSRPSYHSSGPPQRLQNQGCFVIAYLALDSNSDHCIPLSCRKGVRKHSVIRENHRPF